MPCSIEFQFTSDEDDGTDCRPADVLSEQYYDQIRHYMLGSEGHQTGHRIGLICLSDENTHDELLAAKVGVYSPKFQTDTSFAQQMHYARSTALPDVVLATYRSAVPVLAAVEGYYSAIDEQLPALGHIDVSALHRSQWFNHEALRRSETERLSDIVEGRHVLIIDQTFGQGNTLLRASKIAKAAGGTSVVGMVGYWYNNLADEPLDKAVYSPAESLWRGEHEEFMREVGQAAARIPIDPKPDAATAEQVADFYRGSFLDQ